MHAIAIAAGYIGAALSVGMVVPQLMRTLRHGSLGGVSAISWLITAAACFTWLLYGVKGHVWPQIPGNALIVPGAAAIVLTTPARLTRTQRAALLGATAGVLIASTLFVPPDALGYLAFGISLVSALPQTLASVRRRRAGRSAVSIPAWSMRGGAQVFWLFYGFTMHNGPVVVAGLVTVVSAVVVIGAEVATLVSARRVRRSENPVQADQQLA